MKSFKSHYTTEAMKPTTNKGHINKMRDFVYDRLSNTTHTSDRVKKDFVKKFGAHNVKHHDAHVSSYLD